MQVSVRIFRHIIVEHNVDPFNIHSTPEQIGRYQDSFLEIFELLIAGQTENISR